jgi:hypothetical protein
MAVSVNKADGNAACRQSLTVVSLAEGLLRQDPLQRITNFQDPAASHGAE